MEKKQAMLIGEAILKSLQFSILTHYATYLSYSIARLIACQMATEKTLGAEMAYINAAQDNSSSPSVAQPRQKVRHW